MATIGGMERAPPTSRLLQFRLASALLVTTVLGGVLGMTRLLAATHREQLASLFALSFLAYGLAAMTLLAKGMIVRSLTDGEQGEKLASTGMWMVLAFPLLLVCVHWISSVPLDFVAR